MLSARYVEATGIVVTTANALSSGEEFDRHLGELTPMLARSRARHGTWLHLVDATANAVQARDSVDHVAESWNAEPQDDGYVAYVLQSVLAKLQIQRMRADPRSRFCADHASAEAWLLEQVGAASA